MESQDEIQYTMQCWNPAIVTTYTDGPLEKLLEQTYVIAYEERPPLVTIYLGKNSQNVITFKTANSRKSITLSSLMSCLLGYSNVSSTP